MPLQNRAYKYHYQRMESATTTADDYGEENAPTSPLLNHHHHHLSTIPINEGILILGIQFIQSAFERQRRLIPLL